MGWSIFLLQHHHVPLFSGAMELIDASSNKSILDVRVPTWHWKCARTNMVHLLFHRLSYWIMQIFCTLFFWFYAGIMYITIKVFVCWVCSLLMFLTCTMATFLLLVLFPEQICSGDGNFKHVNEMYIAERQTAGTYCTEVVIWNSAVNVCYRKMACVLLYAILRSTWLSG